MFVKVFFNNLLFRVKFFNLAVYFQTSGRWVITYWRSAAFPPGKNGGFLDGIRLHLPEAGVGASPQPKLDTSFCNLKCIGFLLGLRYTVTINRVRPKCAGPCYSEGAQRRTSPKGIYFLQQ